MTQYVHSTPVDEDSVRRAGLFTSLPVRKSKYSHIADEGAQRALGLWRRHAQDYVSKGGLMMAPVSMSPVGNLCAYMGPEALPERIGLMTYLADFGTIYEGFCESLEHGEGIRQYEKLERCGTTPQTEASVPTSGVNLQKIMTEALLEIFEMDQRSGLRMIEVWRKWMCNVGPIPSMPTYDEFIAHRRDDIGIVQWWAVMEFCMGLSYTDEQRQLVQHITDSASELIILSQSYWGCEKEPKARKDHGTRIINAVDFISRSESVPKESAKEKIKKIFIELEHTYKQQRDDFYLNHPGEAVALRPWIEALGLAVGSSQYWAAHSPHSKVSMQVPIAQNCATHPSPAISDLSPVVHFTPSTTSLGSDDDEATNSTSPAHGHIPRSLCMQNPGRQGDGSDSDPPRKFSSLVPEWTRPNDAALAAPCRYIRNLPSKGIRSLLIAAFNEWLDAPKASKECINDVVTLLHDASLLIDDIQDNSMLRRGKPAAHTIYGVPQVMNSGLFMLGKAVQESAKLSSPRAIGILLDNLENMYLGQSHDLFWKHNLICPSESEYLIMIDNKTGGMFRLLARLLQVESTTTPQPDLEHLILLLGRFFQIRDDYMNLQSKEYETQKGFCEDLDEGKFSYPLVHLLARAPEHAGEIIGMFRQLPTKIGEVSKLSFEAKTHILEILQNSGSLTSTLEYLKELERDIEAEIEMLETITGKKNATLRLLIMSLSIKDLLQ